MLRAYFNEVVILVREGEPQPYMRRGDAEETEIQARVDWVNKLIVTIEGESVKSSVTVLLLYDSELYYTDKIRIQGVDHRILMIKRVDDFSANHQEVDLA